MPAEKLVTDRYNDLEVLNRLVDYITEKYKTGNNLLTSINVSINPKYRKANIYAEYIDKSRIRGKEPDDSTAVSCEDLINWPHSESLENCEEAWKGFGFPKKQIERAFLLSEKLKSKFFIIYDKDELNCHIKDGIAFIERVKKPVFPS
jgi:hypothetical protein